MARRRGALARPWQRAIGVRREAGALTAGATGADLTLSGALTVTGLTDLNGLLDVQGTALMRSPVTASLGIVVSAGGVGLPAGSVGVPSLYFNANPTDGMYQSGAGVIRWALGGSNLLTFTTTNISSSLSLDLGGYWTYNNELTPSAITSSQNNYALNAATSWARLSATGGSWNITGLTGGGDGRVVPIINVGASNNLTLTNEDAASTAGNRFALPSGASVVLGPGDGTILIYDGVSSRWRVLGVAL